jgi:hypothetical protein
MLAALLRPIEPVLQQSRRREIAAVAAGFARGGDPGALEGCLAAVVTLGRPGMIAAEVEDAIARPRVVGEPGRRGRGLLGQCRQRCDRENGEGGGARDHRT